MVAYMVHKVPNAKTLKDGIIGVFIDRLKIELSLDLDYKNNIFYSFKNLTFFVNLCPVLGDYDRYLLDERLQISNAHKLTGYDLYKIKTHRINYAIC